MPPSSRPTVTTTEASAHAGHAASELTPCRPPAGPLPPPAHPAPCPPCPLPSLPPALPLALYTDYIRPLNSPGPALQITLYIRLLAEYPPTKTATAVEVVVPLPKSVQRVHCELGEQPTGQGRGTVGGGPSADSPLPPKITPLAAGTVLLGATGTCRGRLHWPHPQFSASSWPTPPPPLLLCAMLLHPLS